MKKGFFEGWYFKMQKGEHTLAAIPGYHRDADGQEGAFLQLIIDQKSYYFPYPIQKFSFLQNPYEIIIDKCSYQTVGFLFSCMKKGYGLKGDVGFGPLSEIDSSRFCPDIMGPFSYLPFLQCRHGILSMGHTVTVACPSMVRLSILLGEPDIWKWTAGILSRMPGYGPSATSSPLGRV